MDTPISEKDARKREKRRERRQKQKERKREGKALALEASGKKEIAEETVASIQEMLANHVEPEESHTEAKGCSPLIGGPLLEVELDELLPGDIVRNDPQQLEKNDEERALQKAQKRKQKNYLRKKAQKEKKRTALAKEAIKSSGIRKVETKEAERACEHEGLTQNVHLKENKSWKYAAGLGLTVGAGMFVYKLYKMFV